MPELHRRHESTSRPRESGAHCHPRPAQSSRFGPQLPPLSNPQRKAPAAAVAAAAAKEAAAAMKAGAVAQRMILVADEAGMLLVTVVPASEMDGAAASAAAAAAATLTLPRSGGPADETFRRAHLSEPARCRAPEGP